VGTPQPESWKRGEDWHAGAKSYRPLAKSRWELAGKAKTVPEDVPGGDHGRSCDHAQGGACRRGKGEGKHLVQSMRSRGSTLYRRRRARRHAHYRRLLGKSQGREDLHQEKERDRSFFWIWMTENLRMSAKMSGPVFTNYTGCLKGGGREGFTGYLKGKILTDACPISEELGIFQREANRFTIRIRRLVDTGVACLNSR